MYLYFMLIILWSKKNVLALVLVLVLVLVPVLVLVTFVVTLLVVSVSFPRDVNTHSGASHV